MITGIGVHDRTDQPFKITGIRSQIETTQVYLHADLGIKERALAKTAQAETKPGRFRPTDKLLAFLEAF